LSVDKLSVQFNSLNRTLFSILYFLGIVITTANKLMS